MPRTCSICSHPDRAAIDRALVAGEAYRTIAQRYGTSATALHRHKADHIPVKLAQAAVATQTAEASDLLTEVRDLRAKAYSLLLKAEAAGDIRTALSGVREARGCLELLGEMEGEIDRRPVVNILVAPEWVAVRSALMAALVPYPDARAAVAGRLVALEAGS